MSSISSFLPFLIPSFVRKRFPKVCLWFLSSFVVVHFHPDFGVGFIIKLTIFDELKIRLFEFEFGEKFLDCRFCFFCFLLNNFLQVFKFFCVSIWKMNILGN